MRSIYSKLHVERDISRAALGLFFLVLLLAPAAEATTDKRGRHLRQRAGRRQPASVCNKEVTGCSVCFKETPKPAAGAEFPGENKAQTLATVLRCTRCRPPQFVFNKDWQNCDCANGYGTAFANGTLIQVDSFVEPKLPTDFSDSMPFPDATNSSGKDGNKAATRPAGGTTTATFAEAPSSARSQRIASLAAPTQQTRDTQKQLQPKIRRQFESSMRSRGYEVRRTAQGTFISSSSKAMSFASSDSKPIGVETIVEQPLICVSCKDNMVSIGGLIGGSYCMPCDAGMKPDPTRTTCVPA